MDKLFLTVLNMSLTGAFVIAAVMLARLPLRKAPKILSYCLWAVAGFRLVFPISMDSVFSLMPIKPQPIPADIALQAVPRIDSGISMLNNALSSVLPPAAPDASANPLQIVLAVYAHIWLVGMIGMVAYGIVSYAMLKWRMRTAIRIHENVYETDGIGTPFVLGILKPKIYLPLSLADGEREYIILHERTHIRRCDHIVKFAAFFIVCIHWFNPLVWAAFLLMGVDMEMSCDERVLKEMGGETKHDYSRTLLSLATQRRMISGSPLAFGEGGVKERVKNILCFGKPSKIIIIAAVVLVAALSIGLALNRISDTIPAEPPSIVLKGGNNSIECSVSKNTWDGTVYDRLDMFPDIMERNGAISNLPYVGNGELVTIEFDGNMPQSVALTEYILKETGAEKYIAPGMDYDIRMASTGYTGIGFTIKPNHTTGFSSLSGDYIDGNTIKGYRLVCTWGENECEYAFIIRSDAAFSMEAIPPITY